MTCLMKKKVGFTNELKEELNDLLCDVTFGDKTEAEDKIMIVTVRNKDGVRETEVKSAICEKSSSRSD